MYSLDRSQQSDKEPFDLLRNYNLRRPLASFPFDPRWSVHLCVCQGGLASQCQASCLWIQCVENRLLQMCLTVCVVWLCHIDCKLWFIHVKAVPVLVLSTQSAIILDCEQNNARMNEKLSVSTVLSLHKPITSLFSCLCFHAELFCKVLWALFQARESALLFF